MDGINKRGMAARPSISLTSSHWLNLVKERGGTFFIRMSVNIAG